MKGNRKARGCGERDPGGKELKRKGQYETAQGLGPGQRNTRWTGGMLDELTARVPTLHHPLHKNAEIAAYYIPSNNLLPYRCRNYYSVCTADQGLTTIKPSRSGFKEQSAILPHSASAMLHGYQAMVASEKSSPLSKNPPFPATWLGPQLIKAAKQSQLRRQRTFLSSLLPPLYWNISLIKCVQKFFWGFLSISLFGNSRIWNAVNKYDCSRSYRNHQKRVCYCPEANELEKTRKREGSIYFFCTIRSYQSCKEILFGSYWGNHLETSKSESW